MRPVGTVSVMATATDFGIGTNVSGGRVLGKNVLMSILSWKKFQSREQKEAEKEREYVMRQEKC